MTLLNGELTLNFTTKNYMQLKKTLKTENLRRTLLTSALNSDFEVLAIGIKQFSGNEKIKSIDDAYAVIDNEPDKQGLFYEFISAIGENGFFGKATPEELKAEAEEPHIDINSLIDKVAPEAAKDALKSSMMTGASTLPILEASALSRA